MLQVKDVRKQYKTGNLVQQALDGVSLNLRDNEFVAILGPSGSGKTTLLNVIGGLDHYDSGEMIINGVSTQKYKDRDWDSYRNHTIGFVFQSYNLIMHQTVLANVELALTISGISGAEKRARATAALEKVGLGEQLHKKPGQMSGGQMQRVAIARALVNDPDIVLADEPTGALDSATSVQVMELLKEVAKDRLVVMVTHNPELAEQYATRIVTIRDGKMIGDTDPFIVDESTVAPPVHKNMGKSSMSFLTALSLSFNNLKTKKARTFLVAFAGSIGIIGIAMILALSNGVNRYISKTEEETLSEYPVEIYKSGMDLSALMMDVGTESTAEDDSLEDILSGSGDLSALSEEGETVAASGSDTVGIEGSEKVNVTQMLSSIFSSVNTNDLRAFKSYLESDQTVIPANANAIEYKYDITPQIYKETEDGLRKVSPSDALNSMGMNSGFGSMMSSSMGSMIGTSSTVFYELPTQQSLYEEEYEVKAGHWPENEEECVVVLTENGNITDMMMYTMGLRDNEELNDMVEQFNNEEPVDLPESYPSYTYNDFIGLTFSVVPNAYYYEYDEEYGLWTDRSENTAYVEKLAEDGRQLKIVGVVQPEKGQTVTMLSTGIGYTQGLTTALMNDAAESEIVKQQRANENINVFTGNSFDTDNNNAELKMENMFSVDEEAMADAFGANMDLENLDMSGLSSSMGNIDTSSLDLSSMMNADTLSASMPSLTEEQINDLLNSIKVTATEEQMQTMFNALLNGYTTYNGDDASADITKIGDGMQTYLQTDGARQIIGAFMQEVLSAQSGSLITTQELSDMMTQLFSGYLAYAAEQGLSPVEIADANNFQTYMNSQNAVVDSMQQLIISRVIAASTNISEDQMSSLASNLYAGYLEYASTNPDVPNPTNIQEKFSAYLQTEEAQQVILASAQEMVDTGDLTEKITSLLASETDALTQELSSQIASAMAVVMSAVGTQMESAMSQMMQSLGDNMGDMFNIDPEAFANALQMSMTPEEMEELLAAMMSGASSAEKNLQTLGYADINDPYQISIYPKDFEAKNVIVADIEAYNTQMEEDGAEEKVIRYSDMVATMMSSVTRIVDTISYVLIAFVAISLIVSSIMIGVITYISVLERRKEIGILRAIGASKHNIAQVFNAETFITGLLAGMIGVGFTLIIIQPINWILSVVVENVDVQAYLAPGAAIILVGLSILLTLVAGLMPATKASNSDPVTALRTD